MSKIEIIVKLMIEIKMWFDVNSFLITRFWDFSLDFPERVTISQTDSDLKSSWNRSCDWNFGMTKKKKKKTKAALDFIHW